MEVNVKAKDIKVEVIKPKYSSLIGRSLPLAFDNWKEQNPEVDIISLEFKDYGGTPVLLIAYKSANQYKYREVEDPAWHGLSLADQLKKVIIANMKRRADIMGFKEFDNEDCFEQFCKDMETGNGVELSDFLEEIEKYVNVWEMDTKTNYIKNLARAKYHNGTQIKE